MAASTFSGPIKSGTVREGALANVGYSINAQSKTIGFVAAAGATDAVFYLPINSQIIDIIVDSTVAYDSVTSAALTIGTASAGTQYASSQDVKAAAGRTRPTFTAAQLTAMAAIAAEPIYATVTRVGTSTAGSVSVTLVYAQK